jgi:D-glucosaminate-6-phosphate ammonia-lyase
MSMSIYDRLGIRRVINATATLTKLGGSTMPPEVVQAMAEASGCFVDLHALQRAVGARIADLTRNEACLVSSGAAACVALGVAACMAGDDAEAMMRLPDTRGLKDEVQIFQTHQNGYDIAVHMTGAKRCYIEPSLAVLESAINPKTACFLWFQGDYTGGPGEPVLEEVVALCARFGVPVLVDAAAQLPPVENFWRFTQAGAAGVMFSGGKELGGPQSSGLLLGTTWLIERARKMASPYQSFARPFKVGKEELCGLLAAVERYIGIDHVERVARDVRVGARWIAAWQGIPGITPMQMSRNEAGQPLPTVGVKFETGAPITPAEFSRRLAAGDPPILVDDDSFDDIVRVNPWTVADADVATVEARVRQALAGA